MATIRDVAREAGVSIATVSRVFNDSSIVSEDTVARVRQVATRLDYRPNGVARSLITHRTQALGVLLPYSSPEFASELVRGMELAARRHGLHLIVSGPLPGGGERVEVLRSMSGRVDGMVVVAPDDGAHAGVGGIAQRCPVVLVNPGREIDECDTVSIALFDGAREMVGHLIGLGHRRIAMVRGPAASPDAGQRAQGYRAALCESGIGVSPELEFQGDLTAASGYDAAVQVLALPSRPTAIFAGNDHVAIGVMSALGEAGVRIPEDVAIAGFDDIPTAAFTSPPLTSVRVNTALLGERSVELLVRARRPGEAPARRHELLPTSLAIRISCGAKRTPKPQRERWLRSLPQTAASD